MLLIAGRHQPTFAALGLKSFDSIAAAFGPKQRPARTSVFVERTELGGPAPTPVFYKQYFYQPSSFGFLGRPSKARCEFNNYGVFETLDIRCAERIACGEERDKLGRLRSAFIITRAIPEAVGLIDFMSRRASTHPAASNVRRRRAALRQLAAMTRAIHDAGFYHHDLVWRNILVNVDPGGGPQVWWIDCPRGQFDRWSPWRRRRQLKDLASLDKCGSQYCSRTERLDFIQSYLGKRTMDAAARALARDVTRYRRERWPEDWHGR